MNLWIGDPTAALLSVFLNSQTLLGVLKVNSIVDELVWYRSCCYPWQYYDTTWMLLMNEWIGDPTAALLTLFLKWSKSFGYFKSYWVGLLPVATATTWLVQRCYFECYSASCYWFVLFFSDVLTAAWMIYWLIDTTFGLLPRLQMLPPDCRNWTCYTKQLNVNE